MAGTAGDGQVVTVDGRAIKLTNLSKVLYPETGTTKGEVLAYYAEIGPFMLPHIADRPVTRKRWPDGVGVADDAGTVFFQKNLAAGTPDWVQRRTIEHHERSGEYPLVNDLATLTWLAQLAALEIHVPQWKFDPEGQSMNPDRLVLDLDPGPGAGILECAEVARQARAILAEIGHEPYPITSGSKGIHLYAPLDGKLTSHESSTLARELAQGLEAANPDLVISNMKRTLRDGKVFVDWSQNNPYKTTIASYSLRGRARPTVATPVTWDEVRACRRPEDLVFTADDLPARIAQHGDLLAPLLTGPQQLPRRG